MITLADLLPVGQLACACAHAPEVSNLMERADRAQHSTLHDISTTMKKI
jgi:hypothetical protein